MRVVFVATAGAACVTTTTTENGGSPTGLPPVGLPPPWTPDLASDCASGFPLGAATWSTSEVGETGDSYDALYLVRDEWSVGGNEELLGVANARRVTWAHQTRSGIGGNHDEATWAVECRDGALWGLALLSASTTSSDDLLYDRWEGTVVFAEPVLLLQPQGSWETSWRGADLETTDSTDLRPDASGEVAFEESPARVGVGGRQVQTRHLRMEVEGYELENLLGLFWPRALWLDGEGGLVQVGHRDAPDLTELALALGYADQAHLSRDFKAAVGRAPRAFERALR
jgi:AraC-like DNA-binding protein